MEVMPALSHTTASAAAAASTSLLTAPASASAVAGASASHCILWLSASSVFRRATAASRVLREDAEAPVYCASPSSSLLGKSLSLPP